MGKTLDLVITATEFKKNLKRHIKTAANGRGPIAVREGKHLVGIFISPKDYDGLYAMAIRELLKERMKFKGPGIPNDAVFKRVTATARKKNGR